MFGQALDSVDDGCSDHNILVGDDRAWAFNIGLESADVGLVAPGATAVSYTVEGDDVLVTVATRSGRKEYRAVGLPYPWAEECERYAPAKASELFNEVGGIRDLGPYARSLLAALDETSGSAAKDLEIVKRAEGLTCGSERDIVTALVKECGVSPAVAWDVLSSPEVQEMTRSQREVFAVLVASGADAAGARLGRIGQHCAAAKAVA